MTTPDLSVLGFTEQELAAEPGARDIGEQAARARVAALGDQVHLHVVDGGALDQIEQAKLVGLVRSSGERNDIELAQARVRFVIV